MLKQRAIPLLGLLAPLLVLSALRFASPDAQFELLGKALYWTAALLTLTPFILLFFARKDAPPAGTGPAIYLAGAFFSVALAYLSHQVFEPKLRVQWDEAELFDTSLSMRFRHTALTPAMALPGPNPGEIVPIFFRLGRRPPLYPFLVGLSHSALGAAENNPIRVNTLLLAGLLFASFCLTLSALGSTAAFSAPLLLASAPLLFWQATSGSMDLLSGCAVLALLAAAASHWRSPTTKGFAGFLVLGVFASYTRYEVIGIFAILLLLSLWRAKKANLPFGTLLKYLAPLPAILVPLFLVLINASGSFVEAGENSVFHPAHLARNGALFLKNFFSPQSNVYNGALFILGALVIAETLRRNKGTAFFFFLALATSFSLLLTLAFFDGNPTAFESARLFLLPSLAMALSPLLLLNLFPGKKSGYVILAIAVFSFCFSLNRSWKTKILPDSLATLASESLRNFMLQDPLAAEAKALYLFQPSEFLLSLGKPAIDLDFFLEHEHELEELQAQGAIGKIYWIRTGTEVPADENESMRKQVELRYTMREAARLPLQPIPTLIYELKGVEN